VIIAAPEPRLAASIFVMNFHQPSFRMILFALLAITAVATVLITPDPTDDVHAVMRSHQTLHAPAAALVPTLSLALIIVGMLPGNRMATAVPGKSLQLLCTCRC
jgi:hypothetical protein